MPLPRTVWRAAWDPPLFAVRGFMASRRMAWVGVAGCIYCTPPEGSSGYSSSSEEALPSWRAACTVASPASLARIWCR